MLVHVCHDCNQRRLLFGSETFFHDYDTQTFCTWRNANISDGPVPAHVCACVVQSEHLARAPLQSLRCLIRSDPELRPYIVQKILRRAENSPDVKVSQRGLHTCRKHTQVHCKGQDPCKGFLYL